MLSKKRTITSALMAFVLASVCVGIGAWALSHYSKDIPLIQNINPVKQSEAVSKPAVETVLLLGKGGENHDGGDLTDTIMIAQILNEKKQIHLISIPRDFLVFDERGNYSKINAVYVQAKNTGKSDEEAIQALKDVLTKITGISLDHYAQIDFDGFVSLVDTLGGVEVDVKELIDDPYYPGPNYSYQRFTIQPGIQVLDGATALKYARSRYTSKGGDLDRSRRQQQILSSVRDKAFTLNPILDAPKILSIISTAQSSLTTDLSLNDMRRLYDTYKDSQDYELFSLVVGENLLTGNIKEGYRQFGNSRGYILEPRIGEQNYLEIQEEIANIASQEEYNTKIESLVKSNQKLEIIWGEEISTLDKTHIVQFLRARGFVVDTTNLNVLDLEIIPTENTLYRGNNPYSGVEGEESLLNTSMSYLSSIFQANTDTSQPLATDIPVLYISTPLTF